MGNCLATSNANSKADDLKRLIEQAEELGLESQVQIVQALGVSIEKQIFLINNDIEKTLQLLEERDKRLGVYWHTINGIWNEEDKPFAGKYKEFKNLRENTKSYKV